MSKKIVAKSPFSDYEIIDFGAVNYMVLGDVRKLPWKVSYIYRKLTT